MKEIINNNYLDLLNDVLEKINITKVKTAKTFNKNLIQLYFFIGAAIVERQLKHGWGQSVIKKLSNDLKNKTNGKKGFSIQNLRYMRQFYLTYKENVILLELAYQVGWGHNILIMSKTTDKLERLYYLNASIRYSWTQNILLNQIKGDAYKKQEQDPKQHNFDKTLPLTLAKEASKILKNSYSLEFLGINEELLERELELSLMENIKNFLLELGYGFCFIGNQFRIIANQKDYYIDLLFFHRHLKCLIAIDLKIGVFKPEYAGKMNFYLNLLDDFVKAKYENPSIGIVLCAEKDAFEVEYALRGIEKPVGVAEYFFTKELPKELKEQLPTPEELAEVIKKSKKS